MDSTSTQSVIAALEEKVRLLEENAERVKARLDEQKEREKDHPSQSYENRVRQYEKLVAKGKNLKSEVSRLRARADAEEAKAAEKAEPETSPVREEKTKDVPAPGAPKTEEPHSEEPEKKAKGPAQPKAPSGLNRKERRRLARLEKQKAWAKAHPDAGKTGEKPENKAPAESHADSRPEPVPAPKKDASKDAPKIPEEKPKEEPKPEDVAFDLPDELDLDPALDSLPDLPDLSGDMPDQADEKQKDKADDFFGDDPLPGFDDLGGTDAAPEEAAPKDAPADRPEDKAEDLPDSLGGEFPDDPDSFAEAGSEEKDSVKLNEQGLSADDIQFLESLPKTMGPRPKKAEPDPPQEHISEARLPEDSPAAKPDGQKKEPAADPLRKEKNTQNEGHPSKKADARVPEQTTKAGKHPQKERPKMSEPARKEKRTEIKNGPKPVKKRRGIRMLPPGGAPERNPLPRQNIVTESGLWTSVRKPKRG